MAEPSVADVGHLTRRRALRFVVSIGIVSLFADMAYEGARGINGPFLGLLGASGAIVGTVAGLGELLAYGLRFATGRWADRTKAYWPIAMLGYAINLLAVPALALAGSWPLAALFMLLERTGKAVRNPPRDAMLAHAAHPLGRGFAFGLHETLDRIGGTAGPLLAAFVLASKGQYRWAYALLGVPAVAALSSLLVAWRIDPHPHDLEPTTKAAAVHGFPRAYWLVVAAGALLAAGFADFPLLAYHLGRAAVFAPAAIPVLYAYANAVGGACVFALGKVQDAWGARALLPALLLPALATRLVLLGGPVVVVIGIALWGLGLALVASLFKPLVAGFVSSARRGQAFGTFDAVFGLTWFAGSALLGVLYDADLRVTAGASFLLIAASMPVLWLATRRASGGAATSGNQVR